MRGYPMEHLWPPLARVLGLLVGRAVLARNRARVRFGPFSESRVIRSRHHIGESTSRLFGLLKGGRSAVIQPDSPHSYLNVTEQSTAKAHRSGTKAAAG